MDFEWKADDGECERACSDSETSTGQSFKLKRTCTDGANSCKGLNKKKETTDCKEYCASSGRLDEQHWRYNSTINHTAVKRLSMRGIPQLPVFTVIAFL